MVFFENNNAQVTLRCRSEYVLKGASVAYCDGVQWDRALGQCHKVDGLDNLSCDFEREVRVEMKNKNRNNGINQVNSPFRTSVDGPMMRTTTSDG